MRERQHTARSPLARAERPLGHGASRHSGEAASLPLDLDRPAGRDAVLVVATEPLRGALVDLARSRHFDVHVCATPLDTCQVLERARAHLAYAIIAPDPPWGRDLRELIDDEYPEIESIMVAG